MKREIKTVKNQKIGLNLESIEPILEKIGVKSKKEYQHLYYLKNKTKFLQKAARWTKDNPNKRKEILKRWNKKAILYKKKWHEKKIFDGNATTVGQLCFLCGSNYRLAIHHKDGNNGKNGKKLNNSPNNLVILCVRCHASVHGYWGIKTLEERMSYGTNNTKELRRLSKKRYYLKHKET